MVKIIIVFVIAIVLLVVAFRMKFALQNDSLQMDNYKQAFATIDRVIFSDIGNAKYYVTFTENGNKITAQTDHYSSKTKSLNPGDEVKIGYFFAKNGSPRAVILDENVVPVSNAVPGYYKFVAIIGLLLLIVAVALFIRTYIIPILNIGNSQTSNQETFLTSSQSPDGKYNLEAYRTEPGATVDFSIRVYIINGNQKNIIYDAYHEYDAKIIWVNNSTVLINDKILDISRGEKYDWRTQ